MHTMKQHLHFFKHCTCKKLQDLERKIQILLKKAVVKPVHMEALLKVFLLLDVMIWIVTTSIHFATAKLYWGKAVMILDSIILLLKNKGKEFEFQ